MLLKYNDVNVVLLAPLLKLKQLALVYFAVFAFAKRSHVVGGYFDVSRREIVFSLSLLALIHSESSAVDGHYNVKLCIKNIQISIY
jgi:hypothetical protein